MDSDARKGLSYFVDSMSFKFPKEIKVIWLLSSSEMAEKTVAIVLDGDLEKIKKEAYELRKKVEAKGNLTFNIIFYNLDEYWGMIRKNSPTILFQIKEGNCLYDKVGIFEPIKKLIFKGRFPGTVEFSEKMFRGILSSFINVESLLAAQVLEELYSAVINSGQAPLNLIEVQPSKPKDVSNSLYCNLVKRNLLQKKYSKYVETIFIYKKKFEHKEIKKISWLKLYNLFQIAKDFVDKMDSLVKELMTLSQIFETSPKNILIKIEAS